jgi:hypothetical protein
LQIGQRQNATEPLVRARIHAPVAENPLASLGKLLPDVIMNYWPAPNLIKELTAAITDIAQVRVHRHRGARGARRSGHSERREFAMWRNGAKEAIFSENPLIALGRREPSKLMTRVRFPSPAPAFRVCGVVRASRGCHRFTR